MTWLQVFLGNHDDRGVMQNRLDRMVLARFVRVLPHDFQNGIYLRVELMGCGEGTYSSFLFCRYEKQIKKCSYAIIFFNAAL